MLSAHVERNLSKEQLVLYQFQNGKEIGDVLVVVKNLLDRIIIIQQKSF